MVKGLHDLGWMVEKPKASMYIWAELPEFYKSMGSVEFSKRLLEKAKVAVSPGIGFGEYGEGFVRIALIENADRIRQALRGIRQMFKEGGLIQPRRRNSIVAGRGEPAPAAPGKETGSTQIRQGQEHSYQRVLRNPRQKQLQEKIVKRKERKWQREIKVGLAGFGNVGKGTYDILKKPFFNQAKSGCADLGQTRDRPQCRPR